MMENLCKYADFYIFLTGRSHFPPTHATVTIQSTPTACKGW